MRSLTRVRRRFLLTLPALPLLLVLVTATPAAGQATWTVVSSPSPSTVASALQDVTIVSSSNVWAVGYAYDNTLAAYRTLALRFNGTSWSRVSTPNNGTGYNTLDKVDASAADNVWAIGGGAPFLRFDGTAWRVMPGTTGIRNLDVVSRTDVWGVGGVNAATRVARWNGSTWTEIPSLPPATTRHLMMFEAVAARTPTDVWAVGWDRDYTPSNRPVSSLVAHWDGAKWTRIPSPSPRTRNFLYDVVAFAANDVWAVGLAQDLTGSAIVNNAFAVHWNGSVWSEVSVPVAEPGATGQLLSLTAVSPTSLWAVGYYGTTSGLFEPLAVHWNGTRWSVNPLPDTGTSAILYGTSASSSGTVWAVGYRSPPQGAQTTLTMRTTQG